MRGRNSALAIVGAAGAERGEDRGERAFEIVHGVGPGVERRERIDQHDLAVEPREMLAKERPHHHVLVGLVAPLHHRRQRAGGRWRRAGQFERREGERGRAGEIARHQEAAGRQQPHGVALVAAGPEIVGEQPRGLARRLLVLRAGRIERRKMPVPRAPRACARGPERDSLQRIAPTIPHSSSSSSGRSSSHSPG